MQSVHIQVSPVCRQYVSFPVSESLCTIHKKSWPDSDRESAITDYLIRVSYNKSVNKMDCSSGKSCQQKKMFDILFHRNLLIYFMIIKRCISYNWIIVSPFHNHKSLFNNIISAFYNIYKLIFEKSFISFTYFENFSLLRKIK